MLQRVGMGDRDAFERLYALSAPLLFGICRRVLEERSEAEDALQDSFVTIWQQADRYDPARGSAFSWLVTLTRNRAVDRVRSSGRVSRRALPLSPELADVGALPDAASEAADEIARLHFCMDRLGDASGLIRAAFFDGSTYAELAERVAVPLATLKSRIRRALLKLRECLQ